MMTNQFGTTSVEFSLVGALFFILLFGVMEFSRALFAWTTLTEGTRRGARLAAVCGDVPQVKQVAIFNDSGGNVSPILPNLTVENVDVRQDSVADDSTKLGTTDFVSVTIRGYEHQLLIPFFDITLTPPEQLMTYTLPRESWGNLPNATGGGTTGCPVR